MHSDEHWMQAALLQAEQAAAADEVPVGAVVVRGGVVVGAGRNRSIAAVDPSAHAEIDALRRAALTVGNYRLIDATLFVTVEPCLMCAGALVHARIARLVYGASEPKAGAVASMAEVLRLPGLNHRVQVRGGVLRDACATLLEDFFARRRRAGPAGR